MPGRVVLKILTSPIISKIGGAYMDSPISKIHIKNFIKNNGINMADYEKVKYHSFNECFTRKILPEKRPVEYSSDAFISPCDSRLSVYRIDEKSTFNIKRSHYKVADLIPDSKKAPDYNGGICMVFRLCVDDYHRYGYVDNGEIVENKLVKGILHTVRPIAVNKYPVFAQNTENIQLLKLRILEQLLK